MCYWLVQADAIGVLTQVRHRVGVAALCCALEVVLRRLGVAGNAVGAGVEHL